MLNARGSLMLWIKVNLGKSRVLFVEGEFIFDAVDKLIFDLFFHLSLRLYKEMKADWLTSLALLLLIVYRTLCGDIVLMSPIKSK